MRTFRPLAFLVGIALVSAAPAGAATISVRYDINEVTDVLALGILPLDIAGGFPGSYLEFSFDTTTGVGTLTDARIHVVGPITDAGTGGANLTLTLLPGDIDLGQLPPGPYTYEGESGPVDEIAVDPTGVLSGAGPYTFVFDDGALLSAAGAPDSGIATCSGALCAFLPATPIDLSGNQAPIDIAGITLDIDDLTVGATSTLTGSFALALGSTAVAFTVANATGTVVPEPGTILLLASGVAALAGFGRRRA